jgi:hypothetical protein
MKRQEFESLLCAYHENTGIAWDVFWDYCAAKPQLKPERKAHLLNLYLYSFGMNRAGALNFIELQEWVDFLSSTSKDVAFLRNFPLGSLTPKSSEEVKFDKALDAIQARLPKNSSQTSLLLSKTLLAVTGNIPAYDRFFVSWLRDEGIKPKHLCHQSLYNIQEMLTKNGIHSSKFPTFYTRVGDKNPIPFGRIVDCVGWQRGFQLTMKRNAA